MRMGKKIDEGALRWEERNVRHTILNVMSLRYCEELEKGNTAQ